MPASIDLIVPGLFNLPLNELDAAFLHRELPALNYILRYAKRVENQIYEFEPLIAESMGLSGIQCLPLVHAYMEKPSSEKVTDLLCQAVHLKPDMHNTFVLPLENTKEIANDISIIINDLNELFNVDCYIESISDGLWLMHLKQCEAPDNYPHYLSVLGKKADQYMEQSKQRLPWYRLMSEMQMFMYAHEINQRRSEKGLLPINSLWCWGGGRLPVLRGNDIHWYIGDESLKRFADTLDISNSELETIGENAVRNHAVCIELSILETLKSVRDENLKQLLSRVERQLFKPLIHRVKSQRCSLKLRAGYRYDFLLSTFSAFKFWKQSQSLQHFPVE